VALGLARRWKASRARLPKGDERPLVRSQGQLGAFCANQGTVLDQIELSLLQTARRMVPSLPEKRRNMVTFDDIGLVRIFSLALRNSRISAGNSAYSGASVRDFEPIQLQFSCVRACAFLF